MHSFSTITLPQHSDPRRRSLVKPKGETLLKICQPRLTGKEELLIRQLETHNEKKRIPLERDEEKSLFPIYRRFFEAGERLKGMLAEGKSNGDTEKIKAMLNDVEKTTYRIANLVVMANYGLIYHIAMSVMTRFKVKHMKTEDLINEGVIGSRRAVEKFDCERGFEFGNYASWWIFQSITQAVYKKERTVRYSTEVQNAFIRTHAFIQEHLKKHNIIPSIREISRYTKYSENKVKRLLELRPNELVLELGEKPDPNSYDQFEAFESKQMRDILNSFVAELNPRERKVIEQRFGLNGMDGRTASLKQVGRSFNLSHERIRIIEKNALMKLKKRMSSQGFDNEF